MLAPSAFAQPISATISSSSHTIIAFLIAGSTLVAAFCAIALSYARRKSLHSEVAAHRDVHALAQRLALSEMLNRFDEQVVLFWEKAGGMPTDLTREAPFRLKGVPQDAAKIMNFSEWLEPVSAAELGHRLRIFSSQGDPFTQAIQTVAGKTLEAGARHTPSGPMLRFRPLSELREQSVKLADQLSKTNRESRRCAPSSTKCQCRFGCADTSGQLAWVNKAYAQLVDAKDPQIAVSQGYELLDALSRQQAVEALSSQGVMAKPDPHRHQWQAP